MALRDGGHERAVRVTIHGAHEVARTLDLPLHVGKRSAGLTYDVGRTNGSGYARREQRTCVGRASLASLDSLCDVGTLPVTKCHGFSAEFSPPVSCISATTWGR